MATQVELEPGMVSSRLLASPLTDSSNKNLMENSAIISSDPKKPVPGPKPRLTPKPFALERNATIRPILAPKPQPKPKPEILSKPDPPSKPKLTSSSPKSGTTPVSGPSRKPDSPKLKPEPSPPWNDPIKLNPAETVNVLQRTSFVSQSKPAENSRTKTGGSITRAKSMGFLGNVGLEEDAGKEREEVVRRPQETRSSKPRPVSAIFLPDTTESSSSTPSRLDRRPLSSDLTSKFEPTSQRQPTTGDSKENTPETPAPEDSFRRREKDLTDLGFRMKEVEVQDAKRFDRTGSGIKRRISLLLDSSSSTLSLPATRGAEPRSPVPPISDTDGVVGVKQRIKELTEDMSTTQGPPQKPQIKPRPLPTDRTKPFASDENTSPNELKSVQEGVVELDQKPKNFPSAGQIKPQEDQDLPANAPSGVQSVRASLYEHVVEKHSVQMMEEANSDLVKPQPRHRLSLRTKESSLSSSMDDEDDRSLVKATYQNLESPSSPKRIDHVFDMVMAVEENRVVSENVPAAHLEEKALTLRRSNAGEKQNSVNDRIPGSEENSYTVGSSSSKDKDRQLTSSSMERSNTRYLRVGALPKWEDTYIDKKTDLEMEKQKEMVRKMEEELQRQMEINEAAKADIEEVELENVVEMEKENAAANRQQTKVPETTDHPITRPRATYSAVTGQLNEALHLRAGRDEEETFRSETRPMAEDRLNPEAVFEDFSVKAGRRSFHNRVPSIRRNPSLDFTNRKSSPEGLLIGEDREGTPWQRGQDKEKEYQRAEYEKMKELEQQREREKEREKQRELERQRERERQEEMEQREREKLKEIERRRAAERELEQQREAERRQKEIEKQRELEKERERQRELERQRERQKEMEQREREKLKEIERRRAAERELEQQREAERRQKEIEREKQRLLEEERMKLREYEKQREMEQQMLQEIEKQKQRELVRQMEHERQKEQEKQKEMERLKLEEMERWMQPDSQKAQEREKQREMEDLKKIQELERNQLLEFQLQKEQDREKQTTRKKQNRIDESQRETEQEKRTPESPLRPKVLDLDNVSLGDRFGTSLSSDQSPTPRWRQPTNREEELYKPSILDVDSFKNQTQPGISVDPFGMTAFSSSDSFRANPLTPTSGAKSVSPVHPQSLLQNLQRDTPPQSQLQAPFQPALSEQARLPPPLQPQVLNQPGLHGFATERPKPQMPPQTVTPDWTHRDPYDVTYTSHGEVAVDEPLWLSSTESSKRPVGGRPSTLEQMLQRNEDRFAGPMSPVQSPGPIPVQMPTRSLAPSPGHILTPERNLAVDGLFADSRKENQTPLSPPVAEPIWTPSWEPSFQEPSQIQPRRTGSQVPSRMRSRSVHQRPVPAETSVDGPLARIRSRSAHRDKRQDSLEHLKQSGQNEGKDTDTLVQETDSQYGTWDTGLHTDDSLTPVTPSSDSNLIPSPRKPSLPQTPDQLSPEEQKEPLTFPQSPTTLLDSSAQRSKALLSKSCRRRRAPPSRAARHSAVLPDGLELGTDEWRFRDTTEDKPDSGKQQDEESDEDEPIRESRSSTSSQPQRVSLFPGMDPSALMAQLKKRGETDTQTDGSSPTQLSRSPKSPFLGRAPRVLPPAGGKENGEESSPQWLKELKTKKRFSQIENDG